MKKGFIVPVVMIIIGVVLCLVGGFVHKQKNDFYKRAKKTTAVITEVDSSTSYEYVPKHKRTTSGNGSFKLKNTREYYVSYEVDGVKYNGVWIELGKKHYEGDQIIIYYDTDDANNIQAKENKNNFPIVMYLIGGAFLVIGAFMTGSTIKYNRDNYFY